VTEPSASVEGHRSTEPTASRGRLGGTEEADAGTTLPGEGGAASHCRGVWGRGTTSCNGGVHVGAGSGQPGGQAQNSIIYNGDSLTVATDPI
jgi:hypothetical protein